MKYILVAVPEGRYPGVPDPEENGVVIAELPEGTHSLDIQAYWGTVDGDGKFRGGSAGFKAEASDWEVRTPDAPLGAAAWVNTIPAARWGNVAPDEVATLLEEAARGLAAGYAPGLDVRLVRLDSQPPGEFARQQAMRWVREHVPDAGEIRKAEYAGRMKAGFPVYLVTYLLKADA